MQIKIRYLGDKRDWAELEWQVHNRKRHRGLIKNPPTAVLIRIKDFYIKSPDKEKLQEVDFPTFNLMARTFMLEQFAQEKKDQRNLDSQELTEDSVSARDLFEEICHTEDCENVNKVLDSLTETQARRVRLRHFHNKTLSEIADMEGVHFTSIKESIDVALKKLEKFFK